MPRSDPETYPAFEAKVIELQTRMCFLPHRIRPLLPV